MPTRRHTPLCKKLAWGLDQLPDAMDPGYSCLDLDAAIRRLRLTWRDINGSVLIDVIESTREYPNLDPVDAYERLLRDRLDL